MSFQRLLCWVYIRTYFCPECEKFVKNYASPLTSRGQSLWLHVLFGGQKVGISLYLYQRCPKTFYIFSTSSVNYISHLVWVSYSFHGRCRRVHYSDSRAETPPHTRGPSTRCTAACSNHRRGDKTAQDAPSQSW